MLGNRIKELRLEKGITQEQLAQHLNVAKSTVGMWENNKREPDVAMLNKISWYFNCSLDQLLSDEVQLEGGYFQEEPEFLCPVCGYNYVHFLKSVRIDYKVQKSGGIALQFECEAEHLFYFVIENYKGNCYMVYTDEDFNYLRSVNAQSDILEFADKKYRSLDEYGKKAVDDLLNTEFERCTTSTAELKIVYLQRSLLRASAGVGNWLEEQQLESVAVIDSPIARKANLIIEIDGDSMNPIYQNGDNVLVNTLAEVNIGDIGIFIVDGNGYIKKLGKDKLISINPEYDDIYPSDCSDFRCVGKVLGKAEIVEE